MLVDDEYAGRSKRYRDHRCRQPARNDSVVEDIVINPRRACSARVTVLGFVCLFLPKLVNPQRACAAMVTVIVLSVCLYVCMSMTILAL